MWGHVKSLHLHNVWSLDKVKWCFFFFVSPWHLMSRVQVHYYYLVWIEKLKNATTFSWNFVSLISSMTLFYLSFLSKHRRRTSLRLTTRTCSRETWAWRADNSTQVKHFGFRRRRKPVSHYVFFFCFSLMEGTRQETEEAGAWTNTPHSGCSRKNKRQMRFHNIVDR